MVDPQQDEKLVENEEVAESSESSVTEDPAFIIVAEVATTVSYAAYQNSVPVIRALTVVNATDKSCEHLTLELVSSPPFAQPKVWLVDRIEAGETVTLEERDLVIDPGYLRGLNEAERGVLSWRLSSGSTELATASHSLRMLAREEWGGVQTAELLAAFVTPNDDAVAKLLKSASRILEANQQSPLLDGYQSGDPQRAYLQIAAVWSAVASLGLSYTNPPASFEQCGQKTRTPERVLQHGLATCLDTTLLFASCIEALGLNPVIVLRRGHCFVGGWIQRQKFPTVLTGSATEVRKAIQAHELIVFETTLVTHRPPALFETAIREANGQLAESAEDAFLTTIDVSRARMASILPLASHHEDLPTENVEIEPSGETLVPLSQPPQFDILPAEPAEEKPTTPEGRIERWQRRLLDLSLRNRLLNFRDTKQTIPILCADISALEDHLASGRSVKLISSELAQVVQGRDEELHRRRTGDDVLAQFVQQAWGSKEIVSSLVQRELSIRLTNVYRAARSDLAEGGSNTLYLAVGFMRWRPRDEPHRTFRAPLLLVPVKLTRRSAVSSYQLSLHEDEVRFNATLIQLLKKDFDLDLTEYETCLPQDEKGVDVPKIMSRIRQVVRDMPGFEVVDDLALATFSFAKYLMWKDLVDRLGQLEQNPVVHHLVRNPDLSYRSESRSLIPVSERIDVDFEPSDLVHPLPADSSQLAAVMAAAEGHDFVLIGPPGTGKSQTIANMIAQCLAESKTVLFVAEKTAALDVVYRRLREHGLGARCIELHSNKSERKHFLEQLRRAWESVVPRASNAWSTICGRLKIRRDELNHYVAALHAQDGSGWSPFTAMGRVVRDATIESPVFDWPAATRHDWSTYQNMVETARQMGVALSAIEMHPCLRYVNRTQWSVQWERDLLVAGETLRGTTNKLQIDAEPFLDALGMCTSDLRCHDDIRLAVWLAVAIRDAAAVDCRLMYDKQFSQLHGELNRLEPLIADYRAARDCLIGAYDDSKIPNIPLDEIEQKWRTAVTKLWPLSVLAKWQVTRLLGSYTTSGVADVANDTPHLGKLQATLRAIDGSLLRGKTPLFQHQHTSIETLRSHLRLLDATRQAVKEFGKHFGNLEGVSRKLSPALTDASGRHQMLEFVDRFLKSHDDWGQSLRKFRKVSGGEWDQWPEADLFISIPQLTIGLQNERLKLQGWTAWCEVKARACALGMSAFVEAIEQADIPVAESVERFELSYVRWWLPVAIDRSEVLRGFQRFKHEDAIAEFRALDEEARRQASSEVVRIAGHGLPSVDEVPRRSELGLLRHQMNLQRPSKAIREMIAGMPETFGKLAPCVLMSPLSIAQYLPPDHPPFDVVIFDEASQITTWDAVGAIARGKQTIVVGDPKQLPPTNFFGRADDSSDDDTIEEYQRDLESILDETKSAGLPVLNLCWHYRSRHESLIAFSNARYYDNGLITFPSAEAKERGVESRLVRDATYDRGVTRTNAEEAGRVVADAVQRMQDWLRLPESDRPTLGVVTFNQTQQTLIQDMFDEALRKHPELEWYFSDDRIEPTVVKNLENVQGDERDVILFSVTYGRDAEGNFYRNFGALNNAGGERRLNVAVTRARQQLVVYHSFASDELDIRGIQSRGVLDLKQFLAFAEKGEVGSEETSISEGRDAVSVFEDNVAEALRKKGWRVQMRVGVSKFRIDIAVEHPEKEGVYLAGIECDGATYARADSARDRDKTRELVLQNLGWEIVRVWAPEWWYDRDGALARLETRLGELLEDSRQALSATGESVELGGWEEGESGEECVGDERADRRDGYDDGGGASGLAVREANSETYAVRVEVDTESTRTRYVAFDTSCWETEPGLFFSSDYDAKLLGMVEELLEAEGPIHEDVLLQRLVRAHGWMRTGNRIKQRILSLLSEVPKTSESTGVFYWGNQGVRPVVAWREVETAEELRSIEQVPVAEISGFVLKHRDLMRKEDSVAEIAKAMGYARVTEKVRKRIGEALVSEGVLDFVSRK